MLPQLPIRYLGGHTPTPKQWAALALQGVQEVFYGGAAGGGKTDWLLMEALAYADVPGYSGILFRESYPNLSHEPDGLIPRSKEWLRDTDARFSGATKTWYFPSGATLSFGYLYKPDDHHRYAGPSYQFIGYDESTEIRARSFQFMFSRLRRLSSMKIPLRIRSASNPGGRSHAFFRDRYDLHKEQRGSSPDRIYIPSLISDNPYLDQAAYIKTLQQLSPVDRERLMKGDWRVMEEGSMFRWGWFGHVADYPRDTPRSVRYWDFAASPPSPAYPDPDWTVGLRMDQAEDGRFYVIDVQRIRDTPHVIEQLVRATAEADGSETHIVIEQEPGASGVQTIDNYQRKVLGGFIVRADKPTTAKVSRAGPISSAAEAGNVLIVDGDWNDDFMEEISLFGPAYDGHDDQVDVLAGAHRYLTKTWRMSGDLMR